MGASASISMFRRAVSAISSGVGRSGYCCCQKESSQASSPWVRIRIMQLGQRSPMHMSHSSPRNGAVSPVEGFVHVMVMGSFRYWVRSPQTAWGVPLLSSTSMCSESVIAGCPYAGVLVCGGGVGAYVSRAASAGSCQIVAEAGVFWAFVLVVHVSTDLLVQVWASAAVRYSANSGSVLLDGSRVVPPWRGIRACARLGRPRGCRGPGFGAGGAGGLWRGSGRCVPGSPGRHGSLCWVLVMWPMELRAFATSWAMRLGVLKAM